MPAKIKVNENMGSPISHRSFYAGDVHEVEVEEAEKLLALGYNIEVVEAASEAPSEAEDPQPQESPAGSAPEA